MVEDADLCALLGGNPDDAARQMVERALDAGGTDNVTAIVIACDPS